MKTLIALLFSLALAFSFSNAAFAHCGTCGKGEPKPHDHKVVCEKKCKDDKNKEECMKKCENEHQDKEKDKEKEKKSKK